MNYAIQILDNEKKAIDNCLKGFDKIEYSEAYKRQSKKSKELENAITLLSR